MLPVLGLVFLVSQLCVQAAQGEVRRQFKSWCVPSEGTAGDEVEMMISEVWTRRKRGQVGYHSQNWVVSVGKYTFPVSLQSLVELVHSEAFFFPKKLSTRLLFCIHHMKRIHLYLISRKLAWGFCLLWSVCATWQSVSGSTEKLTKNKVENFWSHCQPFQVSRLVNAWQLLVRLLASVLLCPVGNLRSKPSGWDEVNHPRNYSVWDLSAGGNRLFGKYSFPAQNEKMWFFLTHLVFCNVGYSCLGQSCRWPNVFPAVPSESSPWFEGKATAPCGETHGHPTQGHHSTSVCLSCPFPPSQSKVWPQGSRGRCLPGGWWCAGHRGGTSGVRGAQQSQGSLYFSCWIAHTLCPLGLALNNLSPKNNHWNVSFFSLWIPSLLPLSHFHC